MLVNTETNMRRRGAPIPVRSGRTEFLKINAARSDWRDSYHWVLSLTWPQFYLFLVGTYLLVNAVFALFYLVRGDAIAGVDPGSLPQAFFFSVETLATVGYVQCSGHGLRTYRSHSRKCLRGDGLVFRDDGPHFCAVLAPDGAHCFQPDCSDWKSRWAP